MSFKWIIQNCWKCLRSSKWNENKENCWTVNKCGRIAINILIESHEINTFKLCDYRISYHLKSKKFKIVCWESHFLQIFFRFCVRMKKWIAQHNRMWPFNQIQFLFYFLFSHSFKCLYLVSCWNGDTCAVPKMNTKTWKEGEQLKSLRWAIRII